VAFRVCVAVAAVSLAEVVALMVVGGAWELKRVHLHACDPQPRLLLAAVAVAAAYGVRRGVHNTRQDWACMAGRCVLFALSTALALIAAEVGLRLTLERMQAMQSLDRLDTVCQRLSREQIKSGHPLAAITRKSISPRLVFELKPDLDLEFGHRRLRTNRMGLREDRDYEPGKPTNTIRIVGIGDSGMFGWDVEQGEEYLAVLESNLNARADGRVYEVINLGVPGYNTQLEVESLRMKGLQYRPDIVIVGWCDNDFGLPYFIPQEGQWNRRDVAYLYYLMFDRKKYADIALNGVRDQRHYDKKRVPEHFRNGTDIEGVTRAFGDLQTLGRAHSFNVLVMGSMQKEAQKICDKLSMACYNTWDRIPQSAYPKEYQVHFMHPRAGGHRALAECLEQELVQRGWLPAHRL
jgi:lysophospholipase L1-like esterase